MAHKASCIPSCGRACKHMEAHGRVGKVRADRQADAVGDADAERQDCAGGQMPASRLTQRALCSQHGAGRHAGTHRSRVPTECAGKHQPNRGMGERHANRQKSHSPKSCQQRQMQKAETDTHTQTELFKTSGSANSERYYNNKYLTKSAAFLPSFP